MMRAMRWFEYNIRSIFYFLCTHTHITHALILFAIPYGYSSILMVLLFRARVLSLNTISSKKIRAFFFLSPFCCSFAFGVLVAFFSFHFSTLTLENLQ